MKPTTHHSPTLIDAPLHHPSSETQALCHSAACSYLAAAYKRVTRRQAKEAIEENDDEEGDEVEGDVSEDAQESDEDVVEGSESEVAGSAEGLMAKMTKIADQLKAMKSKSDNPRKRKAAVAHQLPTKNSRKEKAKSPSTPVKSAPVPVEVASTPTKSSPTIDDWVAPKTPSTKVKSFGLKDLLRPKANPEMKVLQSKLASANEQIAKLRNDAKHWEEMAVASRPAMTFVLQALRNSHQSMTTLSTAMTKYDLDEDETALLSKVLGEYDTIAEAIKDKLFSRCLLHQAFSLLAAQPSARTGYLLTKAFSLRAIAQLSVRMMSKRIYTSTVRKMLTERSVHKIDQDSDIDLSDLYSDILDKDEPVLDEVDVLLIAAKDAYLDMGFREASLAVNDQQLPLTNAQRMVMECRDLQKMDLNCR